MQHLKCPGLWLSGAGLITEEQAAHAHLVNGNHQSGLHLGFNFFWSVKTVEFAPSQSTVQPSPANQTFYCLLKKKKKSQENINLNHYHLNSILSSVFT